MKNFLKYSVYVILLTMTFVFTSCEEEFEEIEFGDRQETLSADSTIARLISQTASNDGSYDNLVDGASCFEVKFPYTVVVNGVEVTIDSREDLHLIEEIFDALDNDADILEILFPITITLADFTEITINGLEDLRELAEACIENGDDEDIECVDFVYPITLFAYDGNNERTDTVVVESDRELRRFFANLDADAIVGIDYPVTLELFDGTTKTVHTNAELADALERAKNRCDEDDDNDYSDDDFTKERLDNLLVECPWLVRELRRDHQDRTDEFFEYAMNFKENGDVVVSDRDGNSLEGTWSTRVTDHGALLNLEFNVLVDFTLEWMVYDIGERGIKLFNGEGNRIILRQFCETDNRDPETLREILRECSWIIKKVKNNGEEVRRLLGYAFNFEGDGVVTLDNGENEATGNWEIIQNDQGVLVLSITMGSEPGVNFEWPLRDLDDTRLKFEVEGFELVLLRECDVTNTDDDVAEIRNTLFGGEWIVARYDNKGIDETDLYQGYSFSFREGNTVEVREGADPFQNGLWRVLRNNDGMLEVFLNFEGNTLFEVLTNDWDFVSVTADRIELKVVHGDGDHTILVLEK